MVYVTGDMHGDIDRFRKKPINKLKKNDTLIICGDFGFIWFGDNEEKKKLKWLSRRRFNILFVDGAHENFELLESNPVIEWNKGRVHKIAKNIFHALRGEVFEIEGKRFFTFGGGESCDLELREENGYISNREIPAEQEFENGFNNLNSHNWDLDYIITHEAPEKIKKYLQLNLEYINTLHSNFEIIRQKCSYKKWFFGCYHLDKAVSSKDIAVFESVIKI